MKPFLFVLRVIPLPGSKASVAVAVAIAHCWVFAPDADLALEVAKAYIKRQNWDVEEVEDAFEPLPEQIEALDKEELAVYQRAVKNGVAANFFGAARNPDDLPPGSYMKFPLPKD